MKCVVIGFGNELRGDEAAGPVVARSLAAQGWDAHAVHQLAPELAEPVAGADFVVFVDADTALPPGIVRFKTVQPGGGAFHHHATPESILAISRRLYGRAPRAILAGIGPESFDPGAPLSPAASRGTRAASTRITALLERMGKTPQTARVR